ncbi:hypothetical protein GJAV_G00025160 [Gymnothorax javanicus]|nr:hypothetical protein GJAV_G00025160 [Gymnothorax javanicus]
MSGNYSVSLAGPAPWGFRLQGGKDFNTPLSISRLIEGGKAAQANIGVGDLVLSIDGIATEGMNHLEAQNKIKACTGNLNLTMQKASSVPKVTEVVKDQLPEIIKPVPITQLAPPTAPAVSISPSPAYNKTARPFGAVSAPTTAPKVASIPSASSAFTPAAPPPQPPFPLASSKSSPSRPSQGVAAFPSSSPSSSSSSSSSPNRVTAAPPPSTIPTAPHSSVYNTPINLYSNENACEVAMGQRRGLLESQGGAVQQNGAPRRPIVETDIHFYHIPSHGNASKQRLSQDTEDWHPRMGNGQSRSFRILAQMTGTGEGSPDLAEGDAGRNDAAEEPGALVAKTMTKAPVSTVRNPQGGVHTKPGAQVGHVAPSFGSVTKSSSKVPAPERPAPRPHPKDEDSLVQRAEHKPASARTPMCAHCNQVIRGPFLVAMGKSWHPEEFNCAHAAPR